MDKKYVVGIDIGGQSAKIGMIDRNAVISSRDRLDTTVYGPDDSGRFLNDLCNLIAKVTEAVGLDAIKGIGIGAPNGNYYDGCITDAANLPWAKGKSVNIREFISERLGLEVTLTNDANAAALGEMIYGNAKGMKNFIEITLGTGVGSGIVIDGKLVYGHDGFAGELGHTNVIREGGRKCGCGKTGCLETIASSGGVCTTAREMGMQVNSSKEVYEAALKGDATAKRVFEYTGRILGEKFADFVEFSAPEAIILFGGVANAGVMLLDPVRKAMDANLINIWKGKVKVIHSGLPESDAAILGAGALAW
ncbi:MAG: ROK family protein [Bacteroidales bacterium]|nr:ROK family protein [Bacteroidales bacterium]